MIKRLSLVRGGLAAFTALSLTSVSLLGAVSVVNGDFEQDAELFTTWPGYIAGGDNPAAIPGWTGAGLGINPVSDGQAPFNDGINTGAFALMQGVSTLEQSVSGFSVGGMYTLSFDFNARNCCDDLPIATISLNGVEVGNSVDFFPEPGVVIPASLANENVWWHVDIPFAADGEDVIILFSSGPAAGGDATFLVDNVSIVPEPGVFSLLLLGGLACLVRRRR